MKLTTIVPNWNGANSLPACLESLSNQTVSASITVVDNGSTDGSLDMLKSKYPQIEVVELRKNRGFAGGTNAGLKRAIVQGAQYVALLNNDAVANKNWLEELFGYAKKHPEAGIVTSKILNADGAQVDSTGEMYTTWGLPYPRGRRESASAGYSQSESVFGASGAASLYRVKVLKEIGLFDNDFFAYYEDVDISFRAQLAGWKVAYQPKAIVYHQIGATSSKVKDFTTYQTMKNLPWLMWKNIPAGLLPMVLPRFTLAYFIFYLSATGRGQFWPATKGLLVSLLKWPKKMFQRYKIQKNRKVSPSYIRSIMIYDLPPNAHKLRSLRSRWWKLIGKAQA
ncbi:hypothetical protein A3F38_00085 [Candidatus Saccharibacteria bacterium RIFCSPHIGHO2_12_FULL_48_21]|nr:MAG: hypothetical protein A3F38_00085 [Candidatus Saccharibacteria bacterium RIFCSPHIGHO2_12_FULL_48_21]